MLTERNILYFFILVSHCGLYAQNVRSEIELSHSEEIIKFVSQFPDNYEGEKTDIKSKFEDILFGKKEEIIRKPVSLVASDPDHFWILDQGSGSLIEKEFDSGKVPSAIRKKKEPFQSLVGICDIQGNKLLFTDSRENRIYSYSIENGKLEIFNEPLVFKQPTGIAFNKKTEEIWLIETAAHRISVFTKEGDIVRQIGGRGTASGLFNFPTHIWIDAEGKVYIVDSMNFRVQVFNSEGGFLFEFGQAGDATGYIARPKGIATDSKGHIYLADALFHVIQIFDQTGNFLYYFGKQGQGKGQFWMPSGIFIDDNDFIYVADNYNARIQVFNLKTMD